MKALEHIATDNNSERDWASNEDYLMQQQIEKYTTIPPFKSNQKQFIYEEIA